MRESVRKVGERFMVGFDGHEASADVKRLIREYGVGHIIYFARNIASPEQVDAVLARLGPDPLRPRADGGRALRRIAASRTPVGALLMDQSVLAGVGNVYRAELLFRHRISPFRPGRDVDAERWARMWTDLVTLMRSGVRMGRIVTTRPEDRSRRRGAVQRDDAHYVYRRTGLPCRVCGTEIRTQVMVGRNLYWCPTCQAA